MRPPLFIVSIVLAVAPFGAAADGVWTAPARPADLTEGELLLGELNCTACHTPTPAAMRRLAPRPGPRLGRHGLRLAPDWIRAWIANPSLVKPGTAMPNVLHGLSAAEQTEAADALTHFLVSVQPEGEPAPTAADESMVRVGRDLYHSVGCVACHAPFENAPEAAPDLLKTAGSRSAPLPDAGRKYFASELSAFLRDPVAYRPASRMPSLHLSEGEAEAIAVYLVRSQLDQPALDGGPRTVPGADFQVFEGQFRSWRDLAKAKVVAQGQTADLTAAVAGRRTSDFGLRFRATLLAPVAGDYTFTLRSDDGSVLFLDGKTVADNDGTHPAGDKRGTLRLDEGAHALELLYFQGGGESELSVQWEGPGFPRKTLGGSALRRAGSPLHPVGFAGFTVDPAKAASGKAWFEKLNCAACHGLDLPPGREPIRSHTARPLAELPAAAAQGCLADTPPPSAPQFGLSAGQRSDLRASIRLVGALGEALSPADEVRWTLARLNCYACHSRDNVGGPAESGKAPWFAVVGNADLGEEGRIPPHLNAVGAKLKRPWLEQVLKEAPKVRPYMATRMPQFSPAAVGRLAGLLETADARPNALAEPAADARDAKWGRKLVGRDGLSCIACHTFDKYASLGIPALGLDRMAERVRWDWFRRYLPDPAALRPGTRMPSFFPDGKAVNTSILDGDTEAQIRAIWAWMQAGAKAEVPDGLLRASKEIVVGKEAVIYRNFIEGAGSRAIGVGYPEHASLAFDANQMRLAVIWQGAFMDAARHSTDRGVGFEPPLGDHVVKLPDGPAFAWLPDARAAWPAESGRKAGFQFLGYQLDAARRPSFHYRFGELDILDTPSAQAAGVDYAIHRRIQVTGQPRTGQLLFRGAAGELRPLPGGWVEVDGRWRVKLRGAGETVTAGREVRVPVAVPGELEEEISW